MTDIEDRWHKWPEEKPPLHIHYLCATKFTYDDDRPHLWEVAFYTTFGKWVVDGKDITNWVTHWRPLPELPEEGACAR